MNSEQRSFISMLKEHSARRRLAIAVCLVAIATVFAVFWALRISGLTLADGDSGNATVTDASADEDATATDGTKETDADGTVSLASYGISVASTDEDDDEGSYSISAASTDSYSYYFADQITLANAEADLDGDYIIYTIIDGDYYVVSADGTLVQATSVDATSDVSAAGLYYIGTQAGKNLVFDCWDAGSTFANYRWTLTDTGTTDSYYIQNSTTGNYLSAAASESVSGTGNRYEMSGNGTMIFEITCDSISSAGVFWVELYDNSGEYITTSSIRDAWFYSTNGNGTYTGLYTTGIEMTYDASSSNTLSAGITYTVTVTRSTNSEDSDYSDYQFVYSYYDDDRSENVVFAMYTMSSKDIADDINLHVISIDGTYTVAAYYADASPNLSETLTYTYSTTEHDDLSISGFSPASGWSQEISDDFDITYTFTNTSGLVDGTTNDTSDTWDNFVIEIQNVNASTYACIDVRADSYVNGSSWLYVVVNNTGSSSNDLKVTYNIAEAYQESDAWITAMRSGTDCEVNIKRSGNDFTIIFTIALEGVTIQETTATINLDSYFDGYAANVVLFGEQCTLSDIVCTDNNEYTTATDTLTTDVAASATKTIADTRYSTSQAATTITADAADDYAWTASVTLSAETYYLYGETNTAGVNSTEWGVSASASETSVSGQTLTASGNTASLTATFYLAAVREYTAYFDASDGGDLAFAADGRLNYFYTAKNTSTGRAQQMKDASTVIYEVTSYADSSGNCYVAMPYATAPNNRYAWMLQGWYDVLGVNNNIVSSGYYSYLFSGTVSSAAYTYQLWDYDSAVAQLVGDTVFYADWVAFTYDLADGTEDGALTDVDNGGSTADDEGYGGGSVNISSFVTTEVFDYGNLINLLSSSLSSSVDTTSASLSAADLTDQWTLTGWTGASHLLTSSLGLIFINNSNYTGSLSFPNRIAASDKLEDFNQNNNNKRTAGIVAYIKEQSGNDLLSFLFDTDGSAGAFRYDSADEAWEGVIGKTYVGEGDYLFQYNELTAYYYYDSARNAASYNQSNGRFYLFDYTVKVNSGSSENDFLPFNYVTQANSGTAVAVANANYWFGLHTTIEFNLPDAVGTVTNLSTASSTDDYVYGNQSMDRNMKFVFMGDDDVWVYVDGYLVLDLGGIHGQEYGEIDFSTGLVTIVDGIGQTYYYTDETHTAVTTSATSYGSATGRELFLTKDEDGMYEITSFAFSAGVVTTYTFDKDSADTANKIYYIADSAYGVSGMTEEAAASIAKAGSHTLNLYYLERGAGQSNLAVFFNISPSYDMVLTKADATDETNTLDNAVFEIYELSDISGYADSGYSSLRSYIMAVGTYVGEYDTNDDNTNDTDGDYAVSVSGLQPGHTYYIVETEAPSTYPLSGKVIRICVDTSRNMTVEVLNSSGDVIESYVYTYSENSVEEVTTASTSFVSNTIYAEYDSDTGEYVVYITVLNAYEYELPATGSTGIRTYLLTGEALVLLAGAGLIVIAFYHLAQARRCRVSEHNKECSKEKVRRESCSAGARDRPRERGDPHGNARDRP